jgi:hypothetical protein
MKKAKCPVTNYGGLRDFLWEAYMTSYGRKSRGNDPELLRKVAPLGGKARWEYRVDWENTDMNEALCALAELRAELERGALILQRRQSETAIVEVRCCVCNNVIGGTDKAVGSRTRMNYETGLYESFYVCSAKCFIKMGRDLLYTAYTPVAEENSQGPAELETLPEEGSKQSESSKGNTDSEESSKGSEETTGNEETTGSEETTSKECGETK